MEASFGSYSKSQIGETDPILYNYFLSGSNTQFLPREKRHLKS